MQRNLSTVRKAIRHFWRLFSLQQPATFLMLILPCALLCWLSRRIECPAMSRAVYNSQFKVSMAIKSCHKNVSLQKRKMQLFNIAVITVEPGVKYSNGQYNAGLTHSLRLHAKPLTYVITAIDKSTDIRFRRYYLLNFSAIA